MSEDAEALESKAKLSIDLLLQEWDQTYFKPTTKSDSEPKWIYYTRHQSTSINPPKASYITIFSQPTSKKPVPRATASVFFNYSPDRGLEFQFETGKLVHTAETVPILGNPVKRLKEVVASKEQLADYFNQHPLTS